MNRFKIAQVIALVGLAFEVIGVLVMVVFNSGVGDTIFAYGVIIGIVGYLFAGLLTAIKMIFTIGLAGWNVAIFLPVRVLTFMFALMFGAIAFIILPIIPIRRIYNENCQTTISE